MKNSALTKIITVIIISLLVPILSYTIYQVVQTDKNEQLIYSIYDRQLDSILFSVNQHCWDIFSTWSAELASILSTYPDDEERQKIQLQKYVQRNPAVLGAFLHFENQEVNVFKERTVLPESFRSRELFRQKLLMIIDSAKTQLAPILRRAKEGYIKPLAYAWEKSGGQEITLLLFPYFNESQESGRTWLMGIFIDNIEYINDIVARKFMAMNDGELVFAVREKDTGVLHYFTEESNSEKFEKSEDLWIIPNLEIQIKVRGTTLNQISQKRARTNLTFLIVVNTVLLLGVFYVLRNVWHEMTLARMKTDFVANVSHELRTPLALIRMFAETLELGRVPSDEKKRAYYRSIVGESSRLTQLINNILDFSKIESHKKEYKLEPADLSRLVRKTLEMYAFHLEQKGFQVSLDADSDVPEIKIDTEAIKQSLVNLLDNAVKFSTENKNIEVSVQRHDQKIIVSIHDHGIGIPESEHKKIFEKFYRVESSLVHNTKGSGLGLNLVKKIMDIHNGQITVESSPGKGSTFSLIFPINTNGV
jgi:two-component system phosphate regulon sensor histidine kinase PhoR